MRILVGAAIALVSLAGCTVQTDSDELSKSLMCLINAGVDATIVDGVIVITEYANDDPAAQNVPQSVIDECMPG